MPSLVFPTSQSTLLLFAMSKFYYNVEFSHGKNYISSLHRNLKTKQAINLSIAMRHLD